MLNFVFATEWLINKVTVSGKKRRGNIAECMRCPIPNPKKNKKGGEREARCICVVSAFLPAAHAHSPYRRANVRVLTVSGED